MNATVLRAIISEELLKYCNAIYETDFDKYISNGINMFIKNNPSIRDILYQFIDEHMIRLDSVSILTNVIMDNTLHVAQTANLIRAYNSFAKDTVIRILFEPDTYFRNVIKRNFLNDQHLLETTQNMLMTKVYNTNRFIVEKIVRMMFQYLSNTIDGLRTNGIYSCITGHFIESIITDTKYYSPITSLERCRNVNTETREWSYTEKDFDSISEQIRNLMNKIRWTRYKGNCYLYSAFTYVYIDQVMNQGHSEEMLISNLDSFIQMLTKQIPDFKLFKSALKGYVETILMISETTSSSDNVHFMTVDKFKPFRFNGSVMTNDPLQFETDMLTNSSILEIKTGLTNVKKNMCKLVIENILLQNTKKAEKPKSRNLIMFNPRSDVVSFMSATNFMN